jgi:heme/copper-type cytochrome/quinol oxidase subunit 2
MVVLMPWMNRTLAPAGALGLLLAGPVIDAGESPHTLRAAAQPDDRRTIDMVAERFLFLPSEVTVDAGTTLEIRLTSEDTDHGFRIIGTDVDVIIPKRGRGEAVVVFEAKEPGDYTFECSQICGAGHSFMRGRIRVRPRAAPPDDRGAP